MCLTPVSFIAAVLQHFICTVSHCFCSEMFKLNSIFISTCLFLLLHPHFGAKDSSPGPKVRDARCLIDARDTFDVILCPAVSKKTLLSILM